MREHSAASPARQQSGGGNFLRGEPKLPYTLGVGLAFCSVPAVEQLSALVVPLTCRQFTDNALMLSLIISLNAVFGFLAQPYVAWKSDRLQTRLGRRRPFLLLGFSGTMLSALSVGLLPYLITGDARHSYWALSIVLVANVLLQLFQDISGGAMEPMMGDTFKQEKLGRAVAVRSYFNMISTYSISFGAMRLADEHEWVPYAAVAFWLAISLFLTVFLLRDREIPHPPPVERYNPIRHLGLLFKNPDYLRVAMIASLALVLQACFGMFNSLYVTEQIGFTRAQLADTAVINPLVTILCALPIGYLIDRFGPKYMLGLGFLLMVLISGGMAYWVSHFWQLFVVMNLQYTAVILIFGSMSSMIFQYAAQEDRGTVFGLVQFMRAFSRFVFTLLIGVIVQFSVSYEPTPIFASDIKKGRDFLARIEGSADPVSQFLASRLSEATIDQIQQHHRVGGNLPPRLLQALAQDLNNVIRGPLLYDEEMFRGVDLSKQSRELLAKGDLTADERVVLNRSLISDSYPGELSQKINYRATYLACMAIGLVGAWLTLTSRPGKHARTIASPPKI